MVNPLKEDIERLSTRIESIARRLKVEKDKAEADDEKITPDDPNYKLIQNIEKKLGLARNQLNEKKLELKRNRTEWEGLQDDVRLVRHQIDLLEAWDMAGLEDVKTEMQKVDAADAEDRYRDATAAFKGVKKEIAPLVNIYDDQTEKQPIYEDELGKVNARIDVLRREGVDTDDTEKRFGQMATNLAAADGYAKAHDYIAALALLRENNTELAQYETEILAQVEARKKAEGQFARVEQRIVETEADGGLFESLGKRFTDVRTALETVRLTMGRNDFTVAFGELSSIDYELDAIGAEIAILFAEREANDARITKEYEEWQRRQPRWDELQSKVTALLDWKDGASIAMAGRRDKIQGHVDNDEYRLASDALTEAEASMEDAWPAYVAQLEAKVTYDIARPPLDQRVSDAQTERHVDEAVVRQLTEAEMLLQRMADLALGMDFVAASDGIQGASTALAKVEQTLRENKARLEAAAALGVDPDTSSLELEEEIQRRLYEEERPQLEERIEAAAGVPAMGREVELSVSQLRTDLVSIDAIVQGGTYAEAVQGVRTAAEEVARVEEMIRDQEERKRVCDVALADVQSDAARLEASPFLRVSSAAGQITNQAGDAETLMARGDYQGALKTVEGWADELERIQAMEDEMAPLKVDIECELKGLEAGTRMAASNPHAEIQAAADMVVAKLDEIERLMKAEEFAAAWSEVTNLKQVLAEYEREALSAQQYKRYQETLSLFSLGARMMEIRAITFPEISGVRETAEARETERLDNEAEGDWAAAEQSAIAQEDAIANVKVEEVHIDTSRKSYAAEAPVSIALAAEIFPDKVADADATRIIESWKKTLADHQRIMEHQAVEQRYLEAMRLLGEFDQKIEEARLAVRDLLQATDSDIEDFIHGYMADTRHITTGALVDAVNKFEVFILRRITEDRDFQKTAKKVGWFLDIVGIVGSFAPKGFDKIIGAVVGGTKLVIDVSVTIADDVADKRDEEVAAKLVAPLHSEASRLDRALDPSKSAPRLKDSFPELWMEVGNRIEVNDRSAARELLKSAGVPIGVSYLQTYEKYLAELKSQFEAQRN